MAAKIIISMAMRNMIFRIYTIGLLTAAVAPILNAQDMEVVNGPPFTPENLISNVFLGEGVEVLNVTFTGNNQSVGFFNQSADEVGINRGIVMSTGRATSNAGIGVDQPGNEQSSSNMGTAIMDPDLLNITNGVEVNDMVRYSITFIPISDTLRFNYVFGSEEYPEYVCSNFNDVFGFFISGPGINGPYSNNAENIALIPGTDLPVTINNLNPGEVGTNGDSDNCQPPIGSLDYSAFYNDNNNSSNQPVYDGFTSVLTAEAVVEPCSTYTIKLVIADVSDGLFDSGVFLEAKSFGTGSLDVEATTVSLDGSVAEGCAEGVLTFSLPSPVEVDYPIDYQILGTAENGVDYEFIPPGLFIPAGDSAVNIPIIAFEDGIEEGEETILIDVQRDPCNRDTIPILIRENPLVPADLGPDLEICQSDSVQLMGELPVPLPPPPSFTNDAPVNIPDNPANVSLFSPVEVLGVIPPTLGPGVIQSVCIDSFDHRWIDDMDLFLIGPDDQFMELTTDNGGDGGNALGQDFFINTCFTPEAVTNINTVAPEDAPFTGNWAPEGLWTDLYGPDRNSNGTWQLLLIDDTPSLGGTLHSWTITFNPVYEISYTWTPAAGLSCADCPNPVATPDTTTTYVLDAVDSYGCRTTDTITVNVLNGPGAPDLSCANVTGSSITVSWGPDMEADSFQVNVDSTGWVPPNGLNQHTVSNLPFLTAVSVQVRGVGDCPGPASEIICETLNCVPPILNLASASDPGCNGGANGSLSVEASGTVPPYTYALGGVENTTGVFDSLSAGSYTVAVVDDTGCGATLTVNLEDPAPLNADTLIRPVSCAGADDGRATLSIQGGSGPYAFDWGPLGTDSLQTGLPAGEYPLEVTDGGGCVSNYVLSVAEPDSLSAVPNLTNVACGGLPTGQINLAIQGGTAPYQITYSDGLLPGPDSSAVDSIAAGTYLATVEDANGCLADVPFAITSPPPLEMQFAATDALCADSLSGRVAVIPGGGVGNYLYEWRQDGAEISADSVLNNIGAGTYVLELTDANACRITDSIVINEPERITVELMSQPASCAGLQDGGVGVTVAGGSGAYTYNWSDIGIGPGERDDLGGGPYSLTVTDENNCQQVESFTIDAPAALALSMSAEPTLCTGTASGAATVIPQGGTEPYTYNWGDGQSDSIATALPPGFISVQVADVNGCTGTDSVEVGDAPALELMLQPAPVSCFGEADGSISAEAVGGAGGYTFAWSNQQAGTSVSGLVAGTYSLTLTDANGCTLADTVELQQPTELSTSTSSSTASCLPEPDGSATVTVSGGTPGYTYSWSDGQTVANPQGLEAGLYTVTVADANSCSTVDSALVDAVPALEVTADAFPASCFGAADGSLSVDVAGGDGNYSFTWSDDLAPQADVENLSAGTYGLTVSDGLGCETTASFVVSEPSAIIITEEVSMISCAGGEDGAVALSISGGTPAYDVSWSNGATGTDLEGLALGTYQATVVDANNCVATIAVAIEEASPIAVAVTTEPVLCFGERSGAASVTVNGGLPPYAYNWSNGAATSDIENTAAGMYTVTITDAAGCEVSEAVVIEQPDTALAATAEALGVSCFGDEDGRIDINVSGGTPTYRYSIDGGAFFSGSSTFIGLEPGTYDLQVRDANGCLFFGEPVDVSEPDPIAVSLGTTRAINYQDTVRVIPEITGGVEPFGYEWFPQDSTVLSCYRCSAPLATVDFQQSIRVIVTDITGCTGEAVFTLYAKKDRPVFVPTGFTPNGDSRNDLLTVLAREGLEADIRTFRIFDRWGEMVYEANDISPNQVNVGWDGTLRGEPLQPGVYLWFIELEYTDGLTETFKGQTTLIR